MIVSFPVASISGEEKGMGEFYTQWFIELVKDKPWRIERVLFPSELVFVIQR
jgi:16S rRNA (guanine(1405)-N(7))-methyltransferase